MDSNAVIDFLLSYGLVVFVVLYLLAYMFYRNSGRLKSDLKYGGVKVFDVSRLIVEDLCNLFKNK
ncbi:MAG: hypothetical protein U0T32_00605 [Chitinophagales bacterium]